jgi:hypothetical protein
MGKLIKRTLPRHAHRWGPNQGQGKTEWTEDDGSPGKVKWRLYPMPPRGGKREALKRGKSCRTSAEHWFPGPLLVGEISALLSLSVSTINLYQTLSQFSCLLILYLTVKKNLYP